MPAGADLDEPPRERRRRVEAEVAEGLLLLEHGVRMRLKNRIIVDTLTSDGAVDVHAWMSAASIAVRSLRAEAEASAARMSEQLQANRHVPGEALHEHDYRAGDMKNLKRRRRVYDRLVERLAEWEHDPVALGDVLEAARRDAWDEIDTEIGRVITTDDPVAAEDESVLRQRLDLIATVDLPALTGRAHPRHPVLAADRDAHGRPRSSEGHLPRKSSEGVDRPGLRGWVDLRGD